MNWRLNLIWIGIAVLAASSWAQPQARAAEVGGDPDAQSAAEFVRQAVSADVAILPAGMLRDDFDRANLATLVKFPTDPVVVVALTGSQLRQAFEKSVSLFPVGNSGFLQLAGAGVEFSKSAKADSRVTSVSVGGAALDSAKKYKVAMPSLLFGGALGYFRIWNEEQTPHENYPELTLEKILGGKSASKGPSAWTEKP